ncbi:MAG TPA: protein kinase [Anaerolineales bacterium]|nr:protein kinase [Anaerolineales bacterium]
MQPEKIGIYEVKAELGRGGMATVYRAYDPRFEREVAVKVLPSELLHADPQFRLRFEREAKIIAQLEHTAIVPVYDVGEADGQPYFVMRYMNGGSLSERIKAGGLTIEDAARILGAIAPGLDEAHSKGIIHRDIKPSNILFDKRGNPYISDFGIAKLSQAQSGNVTGSAIIGTPAYMSPEQAQGTEIDGRADIYALGIILFEMLTGQQPYQADTPMAVAIKHITDPVPHIRKINPQLSEGIDTIIQRAMAKDKNERFATAVEMTNALLEAARYEPTRLRTKIPIPAQTVKSKAPVIPQKKGFNVLFVVLPLLVLGVIAVIAGGLFVLNGGLSPVPTTPPTSPFTSAPLNTETPAPTDAQTDVPIVILASTSTDTPAAPTDTARPTVPILGGADKVALVANNEIWLMNMDGSGPRQLTTDGGKKNDLQWLPDGKIIIFISGKTIKFYNIDTDVVDTLTTFPSVASLDAFQVSHDGKKVMISMNNEIFVVPFDFEQMKGVSKKSDLLALEPCIVPKGKTKSALQVSETRWSADDKLVAWLFKGPDGSDQVGVFDILACDPEKIVLRDNFPGTRFTPVGFQSRIMGDIDWDGLSLFTFNTSKRNNGWGELYIYNWESHKPTWLHPVSNKCCYRDARWSPDGTYLFFAFQDEGLAEDSQTSLYYIPYGEIGTGATIAPLPLPEGFFKNLKEAPQPALHPAQ